MEGDAVKALKFPSVIVSFALRDQLTFRDNVRFKAAPHH